LKVRSFNPLIAANDDRACLTDETFDYLYQIWANFVFVPAAKFGKTADTGEPRSIRTASGGHVIASIRT